MRQTTVQEADSIRFGSGKFEVSDDNGATWTDLGAMRGIVFEESWEKVTVESDNAGPVKVGIRNHRAALAGDLMELNLPNLHLIRGGLDEYDTTAAGPVGAATQTILSGSWSFETFIPIENQMGSGAAPTINSVTGSTDGALLVAPAAGASADYALLKVGDKWGIMIFEDGALTTIEAQNIVINYDYTPSASRTLSSGGYVTIAPRAVKVTNTNEDGEEFSITVYKAEVEEGITINLQPDEGEDPAITPIRLEGTNDRTRVRGDRLFIIYDEQNV